MKTDGQKRIERERAYDDRWDDNVLREWCLLSARKCNGCTTKRVVELSYQLLPKRAKKLMQRYKVNHCDEHSHDR